MELYIWFSDLLLFFLRTHGNGTTLLDNSCHVSTILFFFSEKMSALFCIVREMGVAPSSFKSPHKTPKFPSNHTYSLNSPSPFGLGSLPTILFTWIHKRYGLWGGKRGKWVWVYYSNNIGRCLCKYNVGEFWVCNSPFS